jgi:hypothetical protein
MIDFQSNLTPRLLSCLQPDPVPSNCFSESVGIHRVEDVAPTAVENMAHKGQSLHRFDIGSGFLGLVSLSNYRMSQNCGQVVQHH